MAWLNATPKPDEATKRAKAGEREKCLSRIEQLKSDGIKPQMPPNPMPHVVNRLIEIGLTGSTGMGPVPLCWLEIDAWSRQTGIELMPWEARLIRALSTAYIAEGRKAESENCPPPWRAEVSRRELEVAEQRLRMVLG